MAWKKIVLSDDLVRTYCAGCQATDVPNNSEVRFLRLTVPSGKTLYVVAASIYPSNIANHIVEVYNLTDTAQVYGTNGGANGWQEGALGSVGEGKDVVFRVNNTSGAERTGAVAMIAFQIY